MKHLGDICRINGAEIELVDVIIGGSPCQDLSVAGKKAGLAGERSSLFMEQIRIIKEMRAADDTSGRAVEFIRPRFMVWENVPGAFTSNKGEDFRTVLEETAKIVQPDAAVPEPPKGKWRTSGCIMGRGWSIAWRVLDAQFWGVPQRRRRIALVADFGGYAAPEILFERQGLSGYFESGAAQRKAAVAGTGGGTAPPSAYCLAGNMVDRESRQNGTGVKADIAFTLTAIDHHAVVIPINTMAATRGGADDGRMCFGVGEPGDPHFTISAAHSHAVFESECKTYDCRGRGNGSIVNTLVGGHQERVTDYTAIVMNAEHTKAVVRRLTPLECERLQGYPDGWTDIGAWTDSKGKLHKESSDSARYRALGNSIALPPWRWVLLRLAAQFYHPATLGSLFDGIGGFPLIWEQINGKGSCLWASEVEEFCIAVTKQRLEKV